MNSQQRSMNSAPVQLYQLKMNVQQNIAWVKEEISSTFNRAIELVKTREAFLMRQVEWKERQVMEHIEINELQLNDNRCQRMDIEEDVSLLAFEADIEALRQVVSTFGKLYTETKTLARGGGLEDTSSSSNENYLETIERVSTGDENEDDFIVLADCNEMSSEISSVHDTYEKATDLTIFSTLENEHTGVIDSTMENNWINTDLENCEVVPSNPIADIVKKVLFDNDEAWISCDVMQPCTDGSPGNDLTSEWDHVDDGDLMFAAQQCGTDSHQLSGSFTFTSVHDDSHFNWLDTDNKMPQAKTDDSATARTSIEAASIGLGLQQPDWFKQWLNDTSIQSSSSQDLNLLTRAMQEMRTKSNFNPLAHVFGDSYRRKFQLSEKAVPTNHEGSAIYKSFPDSYKDDGDGKTNISNSASDIDQVRAEQETFFAKIVNKPTEYWLEADAAKNARGCLPLSYWLCPSVVNSEKGCDALSYWLCPTSVDAKVSDRLAFDPLRDNVTSELIGVTPQHIRPSMVDGFNCFVQSVLSSSSSRYLSTSEFSKLGTLPTSLPTTPFKLGIYPTASARPSFSTGGS